MLIRALPAILSFRGKSHFGLEKKTFCAIGKVEKPNCLSFTSLEVLLSVHLISFLRGEGAGQSDCLVSAASFYLVDS